MAIAGIVAGGSGSRMGSAKPKQFIELCGRPVIIHTVGAFLKNPLIDHVIIGINPEWYDYTKELLQNYGMTQVKLTKGGSDRNETLLNIIRCAKEELSCADDEIILTHDAVRPFVTLRIIDENIDAAIEHGACDTVVRATDTIVRSEDGAVISEIPNREFMYQGQTPQSFKISLLKEAYAQLTKEEKEILTDACKICVIKHIPVKLVRGETLNMKITTVNDYEIAEVIAGGIKLD